MISPTATRFLQLGHAIIKQRELHLNFRQSEKLASLELEKVKKRLTPDKWPGSNDADRKLARDRAYAADSEYVYWEQELLRLDDLLFQAGTDLQILLDEQQALVNALEYERLNLTNRQYYSCDLDIQLAETWDELGQEDHEKAYAQFEAEQEAKAEQALRDAEIDNEIRQELQEEAAGEPYRTEEQHLVPGSSQDRDEIPF